MNPARFRAGARGTGALATCYRDDVGKGLLPLTSCVLALACAGGDGTRNDNGSGTDAGTGAAAATIADSTSFDPFTSGTFGDTSNTSSLSITIADDDDGVGPGVCGNGVMESAEECDDGNVNDGDGCDADCRPSGSVIWQDFIGSAVQAVDEGFGITVQTDGNYIAVGYLGLADGTTDGWIRRLSPMNGAYWTTTHNGPGLGNDHFFDVAQADSEAAVVVGYQSGADMTPEGWVQKIDGFGAELWSSAFDAPGAVATTVVTSVDVDGDGSVVVVGYYDTTAGGNDMLLRKYTSEGSVVWTRSYAGAAGGNDAAQAVAVATNGDVYVAGYETAVAEGANIWLGKYDTDGNQLWARSYNGTASVDDYLSSVEVDGSGNAFVCGYEGNVTYPWHVFVRRYDPAGTIVWTDKYLGASGEGAHCFGIARAPSGDVVITGGEMRGTVRDALIRRYGPDGDVRWTMTMPGGAMGPDYGRGVDLGLEGQIYIAGAMDTGVDARDIWLARLTP